MYRNLDPVIQAVVRNYSATTDWNRAMSFGKEEFYAEFGEEWTHGEYVHIRDSAHEQFQDSMWNTTGLTYK